MKINVEDILNEMNIILKDCKNNHMYNIDDTLRRLIIINKDKIQECIDYIDFSDEYWFHDFHKSFRVRDVTDNGDMDMCFHNLIYETNILEIVINTLIINNK